MPNSTLKAFVSYSHKDETLRAALDSHLSGLVSQGIIQVWNDRAIEAGFEWDREIHERLETADIILLLISADFLASPYCFGREMQRALQRHERGSARVIPIILRRVDWHNAPFSKLQALLKDGKAITTWSNQDEAFLNVVQGLRSVARSIHAGLRPDSDSSSTEPDGELTKHPDNRDDVSQASRIGLTVSRLTKETITVTVKMNYIGESVKCEIPIDATVEGIVAQLVKKLSVPRIELDGHPVVWDLASKSLGHTLDPRKTLRETRFRTVTRCTSIER